VTKIVLSLLSYLDCVVFCTLFQCCRVFNSLYTRRTFVFKDGLLGSLAGSCFFTSRIQVILWGKQVMCLQILLYEHLLLSTSVNLSMFSPKNFQVKRIFFIYFKSLNWLSSIVSKNHHSCSTLTMTTLYLSLLKCWHSI
jgi:hypothetical protein